MSAVSSIKTQSGILRRKRGGDEPTENDARKKKGRIAMKGVSKVQVT